MADTESAEGRSVSRRSISNHHLRQLAVEVLDLFEKLPRCQVVSQRSDAKVVHLTRRFVNCGEQHELLAMLDYGSLVEQNRGGKLDDGWRPVTESRLLNF